MHVRNSHPVSVLSGYLSLYLTLYSHFEAREFTKLSLIILILTQPAPPGLVCSLVCFLELGTLPSGHSALPGPEFRAHSWWSSGDLVVLGIEYGPLAYEAFMLAPGTLSLAPTVS